MTTVKKARIILLARLQAKVFFVFGFLMGVVYSFGGLLIDFLVSMGLVSSSETPGLSMGTLLAFGSLLGMPLIAGGIGFFVGLITAVFYSVFASWFKRVGIDFKSW